MVEEKWDQHFLGSGVLWDMYNLTNSTTAVASLLLYKKSPSRNAYLEQ